MTDDDDVYVAELVRKNRRRAGLRLLAVGAVVAAPGGYFFVCRKALTAAERRKPSRFLAPD